LPAAPDSSLEYTSDWSNKNERRVGLALEAESKSDILLGLIHENIQRAQFNRYNLQIFLTIANLFRQNFEMIAGIHNMDVDLASAAEVKGKDPKAAIVEVDRALDIATSIWLQRNKVFNNSVATWDQRWFPRVSEANGRNFLHELDDVKDHLPDRTVDMSYLIYRETLLPFGDWVNAIAKARNQFAIANHLPTRNYQLQWDDLKTVPAVCVSAPGSLANSQLPSTEALQNTTSGRVE